MWTTLSGVDGDSFQDHLLHVVLVGTKERGRTEDRAKSS